MSNAIKTIEDITKGVLGGAIDSALSTTPAVAIVWGAIKGGVNAVHRQRAEVFLNFAINHISVEMFESEQFIDGFSLTFEEYLKQRSEEKRKHIQNIFLGFIDYEFDDDFEMERMYDLLSKINNRHIDIIRKIDLAKKNGLIILSDRAINGGNDVIEKHSDYEEIKYLEYLGIISVEVTREMEEEPEYEGTREDGYHETGKSLFFLKQTEVAYLSDFGNEFIQYLIDK